MISLLKMKISGVPDLLYMFPIFSDFLQKHTYRGGGSKNPLLKFYPKAGQHLGGDGPPPLKRLPFPLYLLLWLSTIESKCFRVEVLSDRK